MLGNGEFLEREAEAAEASRQATIRRESKTPEQIAAAARVAQQISYLTVATPKLNLVNPAAIPLSTIERPMQTAALAGDFVAMSKLLPFSVHRWGKNTPLGKYRFRVVNGQKIYVPWTDADIDRFMAGDWITALIEPGASTAIDRTAKANQFKAGQKTHLQNYPPNDWRHVYPIYPGQYIFQVYRPSTWVKIRKPVAIAAAVTAAVFLGPVIAAKVAPTVTGKGSAAIVGAGTKAGAVATKTATITKAGLITAKAVPIATAGTAGTAVSAGTLLSKVKTGVDLLNKARTVDAIIKGEMPPPPISLTGSSFTDWAMNIAKEELMREAKERAAQLGIEYMQRKMTEAEEAKMRAEILAMQREMAKLVPPGTVVEPSNLLDARVRAKISKMQEIEKQREQNAILLAAVAIPAALMLAG